MKTRMMIFLIGMTLSSLSLASNPTYGIQFNPAVQQHFQPLAPQIVAIRAQQNCHRKYTVVGEVYVNEYNRWGIKRQTGIMYDVMLAEAGKVGGNAIIDIKRNTTQLTGEVIHYS